MSIPESLRIKTVSTAKTKPISGKIKIIKHLGNIFVFYYFNRNS